MLDLVDPVNFAYFMSYPIKGLISRIFLGKSSCVGLLERFYRPTRGEVLIDGIPIANYDHKFIHKMVNNYLYSIINFQN